MAASKPAFDTPCAVLEVRTCANGYVITAVSSEGAYRREGQARGYVTVVVESKNHDAVGKAVAKVLAQFPLTENMVIPMARELP